jgi:hypothetical protein
MEAQHVYLICKAYEDGKVAAKKQQFSNTNPYSKNTTPWLAWIYGWEFGISSFVKKYNHIH